MDDVQTRVYYQSMGIGRHDVNLHLEASFHALFTIFDQALQNLKNRHTCYRLSLYFNNPKGIRELHDALQAAVIYFSNFSDVLGAWAIEGQTRVRRRGKIKLHPADMFNLRVDC